MDRRRLLISIKGDKFNPEDAIFSGTCTAKTVNIYYGAYSGADKVHYVDNKDGTYTYYVISPDKKKQWLDRFVWYNSNGVKSLKVASDAEISTLNNNRFNSAVSLESISFSGKVIVTKSLSESFYNLPKLKALDLSNWYLGECTSMYALLAQNIGGDDTPENTTALTDVSLPESLTSVATEAHKMFAWNRGLERINGMSYWKFTQCANFSEMFRECWSLARVTFNFNNWVTDKTTDIHSMFLQCFNLDLKTLGYLTNWNVSNVTDFSYCVARTKTTDLNLSGWDMRSAVNIDGMFMQNEGAAADRSLNTLNLSGVKLDPSKITNHADVFKYCNHLQQINLTDCDNSTGMIEFIEDQLLTDIPDEAKAESVHLLLDDGTNTYDEAHNQGWAPVNRLIGVVVPTILDAPEGFNARVSNTGVCLASKIGEDYNITADDVAAIKTAESATSVTFDARCIFPDEAQTAANTFFNKCFDGMLALRDVYMLGVDDAVVLAAKTSNFGGTDTSILGNLKVHTDKGIFVYRNSLWVLFDDGDEPIAFVDAEVKRICVENWGSDGEITKNQAKAVTSLGTVFKGNTKITSFDELKYFTGVASLADNAFNECSNLTVLNLNNITRTIGARALGSTGLAGTIQIKATVIGGGLLYKGLNAVRVNILNATDFGRGSTNGYNFNGMPSLEIVDFNENFGSVYCSFLNSFMTVPKLTTLIFRGDAPTNINTNGNYGIVRSDSIVTYVPDEYLSNWQTKFPKMTFKPFSEAPDGLL